MKVRMQYIAAKGVVMKEDHISCWIVMSLVFLNILYHTREEKSTYMTGL